MLGVAYFETKALLIALHPVNTPRDEDVEALSDGYDEQTAYGECGCPTPGGPPLLGASGVWIGPRGVFFRAALPDSAVYV